MAQFGYFLENSFGENAKLRNFPTAAQKTLGAYIALAFIDPSVGLKIGATIDTVVVTESNLVSTIKTLALAGKAYFFGKEAIKGTENEGDNKPEAESFGLNAGPQLTGWITKTVAFTANYFYGNEEFYNQLLNNKAFDIFMFTNNSVECLFADEHGIVYSGVGAPKGNVDQSIKGKFSVMYRSQGFISPFFGIANNTLTGLDVKFLFANPTIGGTGLTADACANGTYKKFTKTVAGAATLAFATNPANSCLEWFIFNENGEAIEAGAGTFDSVTKTLTLPATMAVGSYRYQVICQNTTGVTGSQLIQVDVK
ncbi:hypothetical protein SAMN04515674_105316 [Pseudarcicella hirudinis]|uniref:Uncharacterized protein n=1 Tax=Pseudarcicella hirudinis TaxID=1079859 RepID=A0A1I5T0X5_9BACT|nr:hypothetical protein [Pseudarcicella hirudinis]SFP76695.1 hypothetical protein SAMN04515674_105316 [Pseudarcicella hirudinis]